MRNDRKQANRSKAKAKRMSGLIIPANWDDNGKVIGVAISTAAENVDLEGRGVAGIELLKLVHKEVEIQGFVDWGPQGKKLLVDNFVIKKRKTSPPRL